MLDKEFEASIEALCRSLDSESQEPADHLRRIEQIVDQMLSDSPEASGPLTDEQIKYMLNTGLQKIIKIMFNRRSRIDMPWWARVFAKMLEVTIYGISFDNASLISCALDIFDEGKSSWFRIQYGTGDAPADANRSEEVWAGRSVYYPYYFTKLVNHFGTHDGFAYIIGRVKKTDPKVSVPLLRDLIRIFTRLREHLLPGVRDVLFVDMQKSVFDLLLNLTDDELRPVKKDDIETIVQSMETLMRHCCLAEQNGEQQHEVFCLDFALKCFKSPMIEKRLHGLNYMEETIHSLRFGGSTMGRNRWLEVNYLIDWLRENKIVEFLLEHPHEDLLKKFHKILAFLARHEKVTNEQLELIWKCMGQQEVIRTALCEAMSAAIADFSQAQVDLLLDKIQKFPRSEFRPALIKLLAEIPTRRAAIGAQRQGGPDPSPSVQDRVADFLWSLIQDDADVKLDIVKQSIDELKKVVRSRRIDFVRRCIHSATQGNAVIASLQISQGLLDSYKEDEGERRELLNWITMPEVNFIDRILVNLAEYRKRVQPKVAATRPADVMHTTFEGRYSHLDRLSIPLNFVLFVTTASNSLVPENLGYYWDQLIGQGADSGELEVFLPWLTRMANLQDGKGMPYLFQELLCKRLNVSSISQPIFDCLVGCFSKVNLQANKLKREDNHDILDDLPLVGMDLIWNIALQVHDQKVFKQSVDFLIRLHTKLSKKMKKEVNAVRKELLHQCTVRLQEYVKTADRSAESINRCVSIIKSFLEAVPKAKPQDAPPPPKAEVKVEAAIIAPRKPPPPKPKDDTQKALVIDMMGIAQCTEVEAIVCLQRWEWKVEHAMNYYWDQKDSVKHEADKFEEPAPAPAPASADPASDAAVEELHPEQLLSESQSYFDSLFDLLRLPNINRQQVWDIVTNLPINQRILSDLKQLDEQKLSDSAGTVEKFWLQLLDPTSVFRALYTLRIIASLIPSASDTPEKIVEKKLWCRRFYYAGGFHHLFALLIRDPVSYSDPYQGDAWKSCVSHLLTIIHYFMRGADKLSGLPTVAPVAEKRPERSALLLSQGTSERLVNSVDFPKFVQILLKIIWNAASHKALSDADGEVAHHAVFLLVTSVLADPNKLLEKLTGLQLVNDGKTVTAKRFFMDTLRCEDPRIRKELAGGWKELCTKLESQRKEVLNFFLDLLLENFPTDPAQSADVIHCSDEYFDLLVLLIKEDVGTMVTALPGRHEKLLRETILLLKSRPVMEMHTTDQEDQILAGFIKVINAYASLLPVIKPKLGEQSGDGLLDELFFVCLFGQPSNEDSVTKTKCKTKSTRTAALRLLGELCRGCHTNFLYVLSLLVPRHVVDGPIKSYTAITDSGTAPQEKSSAGFVGLRNMGATCYMNSLVQQFFMIPELRQGIMTTTDYEHKDDNLLFQLQALFGNLQESERAYFDTEPFCKTLNINVRLQQDVEEFFNVLCDRLEGALKPTKQSKLLDNVFAGTSLQEIICKKSPDHVKELPQKFLTLSVEIKNKKDLLQSLESYVQGEPIEDYKCESCSAKVEILMRRSISALPSILAVHLKRFDFDIREGVRKKLQSRFEFPFSLNMKPFTTDGLGRGKERQTHPDSHYQYQLVGVLVHSGSADAGHYYSLIKDRKAEGDKWYRFDDTTVTPFNPRDMEDAAFGGQQQVAQYSYYAKDPTYVTQDKTYNVYMLFYERVDMVQAAAREKRLISSAAMAPDGSKEVIPDHVIQRIQVENALLLREKQLTDPEYLNFLMDFTNAMPKPGTAGWDVEAGEEGVCFKTIKMGMYLLTDNVVRKGDRVVFMSYVDHLKKQLLEHHVAAKWFLSALITTKIPWWKALLLEAKDMHIRMGFADLIMSAIRSLAPLERQTYVYADPEAVYYFGLPEHERVTLPAITNQTSVVAQYIDFHLNQIDNTRPLWRNFHQYFWMIRDMSSVGQLERKYLWSRQALFWLLDYYMGEYSPYMRADVHNRPRLGERNGSPADLREFFWAVTNMVRHTRTEGWSKVGPDRRPPTAYPDDVYELTAPMDRSARELLWNKDLVQSLVRQAYNLEANIEIFHHCCWEDRARSTWLIECVADTLAKLTQEAQLDNVLGSIKAVCTIRDSLQRWRIETLLSHRVPEDGSQPGVLRTLYITRVSTAGALPLPKIVDYLMTLADTEPEAGYFLWDNLEHWRWLVGHLSEKLEYASRNPAGSQTNTGAGWTPAYEQADIASLADALSKVQRFINTPRG